MKEKEEDLEGLTLEVKDVKKIEPGLYKGTIKEFKRRTEPYDYIDVYVHVDQLDMDIKKGYPAVVSVASGLGKFCMDMGMDLNSDKINLSDLVGVPVVVSIVNNSKGFAEITSIKKV